MIIWSGPLPLARPHDWVGRLSSPRKGAARVNLPAEVAQLVGTFTMRAERGALTAAPALSGYGVFGKTVIIRAIAKSACVEATVNAGPNHLVEDEILGVTYGKNFRGWHVSWVD